MAVDLEAVLQACEHLYAPALTAEFSERMLAALKPVLPSMMYSWEMLSVTGAGIESMSARCEDDGGPFDISHVLPAYQAHVRQHPFAAAALSTAGQAVVTRSELLPDCRWERTDFYNLVLRPLGVKDQLTLTFHGDTMMAALVFHQEHAVSETSRRLLHLLAPHIQQAINASFRWDEAARASAASGSPGRVLVGFDGRVKEMEPAAVALLQHHFAHERFSDRELPAAVRAWFDGAARAMWSASEPAALREGFIATPLGRLRLTLLTQFAARRHVILMAVDGPSPVKRETTEGDLSQLTPREREVLHWIAQGKRNGEIAIILRTAPSTVKSQVESILRKLGVETRGAAAAMWRTSIC